MITESVKTILGADLSNQVEAALKGKGKDGKDVDLVVSNDGTFVPADKYNGANSGKTSAENALKAAAEALKAIGGSGDPAKIADDVKTAQDPADIISLLDLDKIEVDAAGTLKTDLDGLLKPLKESKAYLFKSQDPANPDIKGAKPADPGARQEPAAKVDGPVVI